MSDAKIENVKKSVEYKEVENYYRDRVAERSKVPLINHIKEGLIVLNEINANETTMKAYCLHPLFQNDSELGNYGLVVASIPSISPVAIMLTMEYRARANDWLSEKVNLSNGLPILDGMSSHGCLNSVKQMLIADKVQNYKDFKIHHLKSHQRSKDLDAYFNVWLRELGVSHDMYEKLERLILEKEAIK